MMCHQKLNGLTLLRDSVFIVCTLFLLNKHSILHKIVRFLCNRHCFENKKL